MSTRVLTVQQLTAPGFAESMSQELGDCEVVFPNRKRVVMPLRLALMNGIFWDVYNKFNIQITPEEIFWIDCWTDTTTNTCATKIYRDLVLKHRYQNHLDVLSDLWMTINRIFKFIHRNCREYQVSLDAWALDKMCMDPVMKELCTRQIDERVGTRMAEKLHTQMTNEMYKALQTPGKVNNNALAPFMKVGFIKRNQLPQMFGAYGTRSDIDDTMFKHVINANAFTGLEDVTDFATEYTSAKKAQYFNTGTIRKAQYFARRMRLGASRTPNIHPGWCGSTFTLPVILKAKYKKNFIGKYIKVTRDEFEKFDTEKVHLFDDCSIALTPENIDYFVDKEIHMWSPFGCRHTDGVCEHCAGFMNQHACAFLPPEIQVGVCVATHLSSVITQKILSAKHLIKTTSKEFVLNQIAMKFFSKNSDALFWQASAIGTLKKCYARIDVTDIGPTSDLEHSPLPSGEAWSQIDRVQIIGANGNVIEDIGLTDWTTHPYFSNYVMTYMRDHYKDLRIKSEYVDIPLRDYDFHKPFLLITVVNDDMVSYVSEVDKFLCSKICDYRNIADCFNDFCTLVFNKADISVFYIEMMLRAFLVTQGGKDHKIPIITDPNQPVEFDRMSSMISESALSTKLSFERLEELFDHPDATLYKRGAGYGFNDSFFSFNKRA